MELKHNNNYNHNIINNNDYNNNALDDANLYVI